MRGIMLIPPFVAGMGAVGYGPASRLTPSTLSCLLGGRVEGLFVLNGEDALLAHLFAGPELLRVSCFGKFDGLVVVFANDLLDFGQ